MCTEDHSSRYTRYSSLVGVYRCDGRWKWLGRRLGEGPEALGKAPEKAFGVDFLAPKLLRAHETSHSGITPCKANRTSIGVEI